MATVDLEVNVSIENISGDGPLNNATSNDAMPDAFFYINFIDVHFIVPLLCLLGAVENFLLLVIVFYHGFKESTQILIFSLAVSDMNYSIANFFTLIYVILQRHKMVNTMDYVYFMNYFLSPFRDLNIAISVYIVVTMSVERMIAVWFPFRAGSWITPRRTTAIVVSIVVFFLIWLILNDSTYYTGVETAYNPLQIITLAFLLATFPPGVITISSIMLTIRLVRSSKSLHKLSTGTAQIKRKKEIKSVKTTLLFTVVVTTLRILPTYFLTLIVWYTPLPVIPPNVDALLEDWQRISWQSTAILNLILYVKMSPKFSKSSANILKQFFRIKT